ncbi:platelet-activating factor acetylhydrolase [Stylonychia lemnae]|uniref:1-alkyl-2-acetylglycerophosphocholine esterase n=1 Tax=Stylonychia lemnae TaxID=5949 RepID=A0A078ASR1_STYLE|nr:platelet-activating factor acetylhydrolase [Stylonychia lemnae]|eukprot:CDW85051.1 platelet-activating factor acetylhydrolase [Stylonychia lemnae]
MRICERLQYLIGVGYYTHSIIEHHYSQYILFGTIILLLVLGYIIEGLRMHQFPFILGFLVQGIVFLINGSNIVVDIIGLIFTSFSVVLLVLFGEVTFNRSKAIGPYEVGYKEFKTQKYDNAVSVYYPINKDHHKRMVGRNNVSWLRDGDKTLLGIAKASGSYGSDKHVSIQVFRHLRKVMMNVVQNGEIDVDFYNKPIIPLVYCHGLSSNRTMHSGTCKDLASSGYMVFILDHKDGTSSYTYDKDGKENYYHSRDLAYDYELRRTQMKIREQEIEALIDEIYDQEQLLQNQLKFPKQIKLDLDKFICSGHSFGGITAISVSRADARVKACFTLDPWLYAYHKEINAGEFFLEKPYMTCSNELFHPVCLFESWNTLKDLHKYTKDQRQENVVFRHAGHLHQCDLISLIPMELYVLAGWRPRTGNDQIYQAYSMLCLSFLSRIGFSNNTFDATRYEKKLSSMERQFIRYDIRYGDYELQEYKPPAIKI